GGPHNLVDLLELWIGLPHHDRPGDVRAVAIYPAAEVQDDGVAGLDSPGSGLVVRRGPVGAGPDDREADLLVTVALEGDGKLAGHLTLGSAGEPNAEHLGERSVGGVRDPAQQLELAVVLDRAKQGESGARRHERASTGGSLEPDQV